IAGPRGAARGSCRGAAPGARSQGPGDRRGRGASRRDRNPDRGGRAPDRGGRAASGRGRGGDRGRAGSGAGRRRRPAPQPGRDDPARGRTEIAADAEFDVAVVGGGAAGLWTALIAAEAGSSVCLVSRTPLSESASFWAQGGLAAALERGDSPAQHALDTIAAG